MNRDCMSPVFSTCAKELPPQKHFLEEKAPKGGEENKVFLRNSENRNRFFEASERKIVAHFNLLLVEKPFKMLLKDKICIVTGAAVGLGRAFCEQLLKQGAFVRNIKLQL